MGTYIIFSQYGQARPYADTIYAGEIMVGKSDTEKQAIKKLQGHIRNKFYKKPKHWSLGRLNKMQRIREFENSATWKFEVVFPFCD